MTTETSTPAVDTPADKPEESKEVNVQPSTQLGSGSEAPSEAPAVAAVEESVPSVPFSFVQENENGDALLTDEESYKNISDDANVVRTESPSVDSDEKHQGIKNDIFALQLCYGIMG
jgi:hypothetical protein